MMKQYISPKIKSLIFFFKKIFVISHVRLNHPIFFKKIKCILLSILIVGLFVNKFFSVGNK
jgi:hypothetical protein